MIRNLLTLLLVTFCVNFTDAQNLNNNQINEIVDSITNLIII
jgi:hypothetical protein